MTVLVSDSFNRADSTTLGTTDSYNGGAPKAWSVYGGGSYGISSNQAYAISSGSNSDQQFAGMDIGAADVTLTITFAVISGSPFIVFRAVSNTNYLMFQAKTSSYNVYYYNGSTWTTLKTIGTTPTNGDVIKITTSGTTITFTINGGTPSTLTSSQNQTSTIFGLSAANSTIRFDNFEIDGTGSTSTSITATTKSSSNQTTTLSDSRALSGSVVKSSSSQVSASLSNQVSVRGTWKSNTSQTAGMTDAVPVTLSSTVKSQSTVTLVSLLDSDGLSSTVKSNSSGNAAILLDRMAESTTVSSTSSEHDGMTVLRAMSTTVESNTTASSASLSMYNGTWVLVDSNAKSNSSSSLASQVSRLMVSTVKTQSIVTGGLRQNVNVQSTVLSATGTTNNVTIQGPIVRLVSRNRSNSFAKVASTMTKTNPKVTTRSFTKATGYLLNLQVVSQLIETIKFKRGNKATLPTLNVGEPAFTLDTDEMFVGSSTGNIKILGMITATSVANLPNPSSTNEWSIAGILGDGSTTADTLYMCLKSSNGTYSWKQIISG